MLGAGGGAIVNNASIAGMIADPGISAYVAAKHGVIGLSKAAGIEYASQGIRINALAPGLVETAMTKPWFDDPNIRRLFSPIRQSAASRNRKRWPVWSVSLLRLRIIRCRSDFCDRWRLHRSLRSERTGIWDPNRVPQSIARETFLQFGIGLGRWIYGTTRRSSLH